MYSRAWLFFCGDGVLAKEACGGSVVRVVFVFGYFSCGEFSPTVAVVVRELCGVLVEAVVVIPFFRYFESYGECVDVFFGECACVEGEVAVCGVSCGGEDGFLLSEGEVRVFNVFVCGEA